jgi:hypothetical protein
MSLVGLVNLPNHLTGYNTNGTPVIMNKNKNETFFKKKEGLFIIFKRCKVMEN